MSTENKLSQKEYLKRYLSNDKDEKKKKKKRKIVSSSTALKRSQIIDDDVDLKNMRVLDDDEIELYQLDEDAPQIAGIIDERPPEVQAEEYYGNKKRWKVFGADSGDGDELMIKDSFDNSKEVLKKDRSSILSDLSSSKLVGEQSLNKKNGDSDLELPRKQGKHESNVVNSSFHKLNKETSSNLKSRRSGGHSDISPPRFKGNRKNQKSKSNRSDDSDLSPPRTNSDKRKYENDDSDLSPPRRSDKSSVRKCEKPSSGSDLSPPRRAKSSAIRNYRTNSDSDLSPPRRSDKFRKKKSGGSSDSDLSPPRRSGKHERKSRHFKDSDFSPPRKDRVHLNSRKYKNGSDSDHSPPRRNHKSVDSRRSYTEKYSLHERDSDRYYKNNKESSKISYYKKDRRKHENSGNGSDSDRRGDNSKKSQSSKGKDRFDSYSADLLINSKDSKSDKMTKTLEGKRAGLQNAKELKKELSEFKEKEDQLFSKLSSDLSGRGAETVMRDRKTGRKRDLEKERSDALQKAEKSAEQNEKYSKWGRGLKQVEDAAERAASAIHEMSKPLARYADDNDLDKFLKAQEREGDPMLDYIRQKQSEAIPLTESKPVYKGSFLPNRFGIRPGYRWDGVDRSNGYEKQWFTTQNNRKARDEEAYKWSTSDM